MMLATAALAVLMIVVPAVWIAALVKWDGEKHGDRDCESCPFPPCGEKERER